MKISKSVVDKRREKMLSMISKTGDIKVPELANIFKISEITIRRDLQYLEDNRLIERYYGGARILDDIPVKKEDALLIYRENIAKYAAKMVEDGDSIFINTSSTALEMIKYIKAKNVTVITNNGNAINTRHSSEVTIILTGGELRHIKGTMVGEFAIDSLNKVTAKKSFIGCSGLSIESGMTTEILNEVKINEAMISRVVGKTYILADSTKFGINSSFVSCPIDKIKNIITDEKANAEMIEILREKGVFIHQVKIDDEN